MAPLVSDMRGAWMMPNRPSETLGLMGVRKASRTNPFNRLGYLTFHLAFGGNGWISHREGFETRSWRLWPDERYPSATSTPI